MNKIVIFGVGLIGGSLALALRRKLPALQIVGIGRTGENLQPAIDLGVINSIATDVKSALAGADLVVLAAPVAQTSLILSAIAPHLAANTVITDVGSTKSDVIEHAQKILGKAITGASIAGTETTTGQDAHSSLNQYSRLGRFVPGHPIAGAEKSGVSAAKADLFDGKNVVLTPLADTDPQALETVSQLWQLAGAQVNTMTAAEHDGIFAAVSHLPHLLAFALVNDLAQRANAEQLFSFAASGFRDFTRIAGSSPEMWRDISLANRTALLQELQAYQAELARMQTLLENANSTGLQAVFEHASAARIKWGQRETSAPSSSQSAAHSTATNVAIKAASKAASKMNIVKKTGKQAKSQKATKA